MSDGAKKQELLSVDDYLALESAADTKHEYLGGIVHAMAGGTYSHAVISCNIIAALTSRLAGKPCRPLNSDFKIRIRLGNQTRFYYPDASVVCRTIASDEIFHDEPVVVIEVVSKSTRRVDTGEKKDGYLTIPSLQVYLLVEQNSPTIIAFRRTDEGFVREIHDGLAASVPLPEIGAVLPLCDVFESARFEQESEVEQR